MKRLIIPVCFFIFAVIFLFLLFGFGIKYKTEFANSVNGISDWFFETSGWGTEHHITNWLTVWNFTRIGFNLVKKPIAKFLIVCGFTLLYAVTGEILEQLGRNYSRLIPGIDRKKFDGYTSETNNDVVLSDLFFQSILGGIEASILIYLLSKKLKFKNLFFPKVSFHWLKIFIWLIFSSSGFLSTLYSEINNREYLFGFYAQIFLKLGILFTFEYFEKYSKEGTLIFYSIQIFYLLLQYIGTFHLKAPGVIISHIIGITIIPILYLVF